MGRFSRYLATWSRSQLLIVSVLWVLVVILAALQTPPVRAVMAIMELVRLTGQPMNVALPMTALRVIAVATPVVALAPPIIVFLLWRRARRGQPVTRAA